MRALADDQVVTHFVYDGNNERVLKLSETWHRIFTNSEKSGEDKDAEVEVEMFYTLYPNQYMVIRPDGNYTKHYYMGSERIASKIGDPEGYLVGDPTGVMLDVTNNTQATLEGYVDENYAEFELDIEIYRPDAPADPTLGMSDTRTANEPMRYFFHKDQVGSSSFITDGVGDPIQFIGYTPFGESFINVSATHFQTPYRFNGKEQDAETGLYNYGARYYDPKISRWMSVDPLADERSWLTPYNYVQNNPLNRIDPTGAIDSPIYGEDGTFLGTDSEGFKGEIIVMNEYVYDRLSDGGSKTLDHDLVMNIADNTTVASNVLDANLSAEAWQNITTDILSKTDGVDVGQLYNGKTSVLDFITSDKANDPENYLSLANTTIKSGKIKITSFLFGGSIDSELGTVENVQNTLGAHEFIGHGLKGFNDHDRNHHKAYETQMGHSSWKGTTPNYKKDMLKRYHEYKANERY